VGIVGRGEGADSRADVDEMRRGRERPVEEEKMSRGDEESWRRRRRQRHRRADEESPKLGFTEFCGRNYL